MCAIMILTVTIAVRHYDFDSNYSNGPNMDVRHYDFETHARTHVRTLSLSHAHTHTHTHKHTHTHTHTHLLGNGNPRDHSNSTFVQREKGGGLPIKFTIFPI